MYIIYSQPTIWFMMGLKMGYIANVTSFLRGKRMIENRFRHTIFGQFHILSAEFPLNRVRLWKGMSCWPQSGLIHCLFLSHNHTEIFGAWGVDLNSTPCLSTVRLTASLHMRFFKRSHHKTCHPDGGCWCQEATSTHWAKSSKKAWLQKFMRCSLWLARDEGWGQSLFWLSNWIEGDDIVFIHLYQFE